MTGHTAQSSRISCGAEARPLHRLSLFAWAGIIGPILFTVMFLAQEAFRRDEYDPISEVVSALEAGPNGWVQQVNFVVFGLLTIAFAVGLHRGLRTTKGGIIGPALVGQWHRPAPRRCPSAARGRRRGDLRPRRSRRRRLDVLPHQCSRADRRVTTVGARPEVARLATYTLVCGILALAAFVVMGRFVMPDDAPLHEWAGLAQRAVIIVIVFPCRIILSHRLLDVARGPR